MSIWADLKIHFTLPSFDDREKCRAFIESILRGEDLQVGPNSSIHSVKYWYCPNNLIYMEGTIHRFLDEEEVIYFAKLFRKSMPQSIIQITDVTRETCKFNKYQINEHGIYKTSLTNDEMKLEGYDDTDDEWWQENWNRIIRKEPDQLIFDFNNIVN